jgi:hypothetical protein
MKIFAFHEIGMKSKIFSNAFYCQFQPSGRSDFLGSGAPVSLTDLPPRLAGELGSAVR